ncbi:MULTISPECIES: hypothetical protein [Pseudomonas]|uniref:Integrase n=1 Tax=Pseudomonas helleri TaxID=1608996 RepID=A0A7X1WZS1_9PSED|nr:hypothetical protein [Pseudomonas helleri]MQT77659.1 hypothetical protein [Pseudomonas helleri]
MRKRNNPDTLARAQEQIDKISGADSYTAVGMRTSASRAWLLALYTEDLIDHGEYGRLSEVVDQQRDQREAELKAAAKA